MRGVLSGTVFRTGRFLDDRLRTRRAAIVAYQAALRLAPARPAVLFRLGRAREARQNWQAAREAYSAGIALDPPNLTAFLSRRARVLAKLKRWDDAIADCEASPGVPPPATLVPKLAERLRADGRTDEATRLLIKSAGERPTAKVLTALGDCLVELGDLDEAVRWFEQAVEKDPTGLAARSSLGRAEARRSLVPFELVNGAPTVRPADVRERAGEAAAAHLRHVIDSSRSRVWAPFWLGRLLETHGRLDEAYTAYTHAVDRVRTVDQPWAHNSGLAWQFRSTYVKHRISGEPSDDYRINRRVVPRATGGDLSGVAGFFEASISKNGLLVEGFLLHEIEGSADIYVDDVKVLSVVGNGAAWHPDFRTTIVHPVLNVFPKHSRLNLRAGGAELVTVGGARAVDVTVPDGTGQLLVMLESGRTITKKGRWADALVTTGTAEADALYLNAYDTARTFFEDELGLRLFVSYGTLLGCYRDGRLIPGDDDFDVSYVSTATTPEDLKADGRRVIEALLRGGFDARVAVDGRMLHLRVGDVVLDVNPFWFFDGRAWSFDAHQLDREVFEPVCTLGMGAVQVYIPARPEEFLAENYGPDWRIPRSDFQYHRSSADQKILRKARLVPSEVRALQEASERLRAQNSSAGRFHGYADPADPLFKD